MRITSQNAEIMSRPTSTTSGAIQNITEGALTEIRNVKAQQVRTQHKVDNAKAQDESKDAVSKEQLQKAIEIMNDVIEVQHKSSKFVFHEGLDKYYVKLVDSKTEELIKEIPPERLLDAYYEMQKLTGMIVDEKI